MKNRIKHIYMVLALVLTFGCEKGLDLLPPDILTSGAFFKSANDFKIAANDFYRQFPDFHLAFREHASDLTYAGGPNTTSNSTFIEPAQADLWDDSYARIRNAFVLIEAVEQLEAGEIKDQVQVYKGEAHFFLARNYFELLKSYGGVPLVTSTLKLDDEIVFGPRNSRNEIIDFIMQNLDLAIANVGTLTGSADQGRLTKNAVRAYKARVALFEGTWRKFHSLGDENTMLDLAINEARTVINSGEYELFKSAELGDESYYYLFNLVDEQASNPAGIGKSAQKEFILAKRHSQDDFAFTAFPQNIALQTGSMSPTLKMADMFLDNTGLPIDHASSVFQGHGFTLDAVTGMPTNTEFIDRDPRMANNFIQPFQQYWTSTEPWNRDFSNPDLLGTGFFNDGFQVSPTGYLMKKLVSVTSGGVAHDFPILRLAEVMLVFAEATFERNDAISDGDLDISINMLRDRVDMPRLTNTFVSANGLDMRTEIRRERAVELMGEGFRYDDIRRWRAGESELAGALKGVQWTNSPLSTAGGFNVYNPRTDEIESVDHSGSAFATDADGFIVLEPASDRTFTDKYYLLPLPLRQIELNPALEQNPGWNR